jgi:hypothetical protein
MAILFAAQGNYVEYSGHGQRAQLAPVVYIRIRVLAEENHVKPAQPVYTSKAIWQTVYTAVEAHTTARTANNLLCVVLVLRGNVRKQWLDRVQLAIPLMFTRQKPAEHLPRITALRVGKDKPCLPVIQHAQYAKRASTKM